MFIVLLRFSDNKAQASQLMAEHNQWLKQGFDDQVFLMAGGLQPGLGGAVIAHGESRLALAQRVNQDPFVQANVVTADILEIEPKQAEERLRFLLSASA